MCCSSVSFSNINIKILGPRIDGSVVDDLADLIDGDGDGKCREANGNFIPCPPKALVNLVREIRQKIAKLDGNESLGEREYADLRRSERYLNHQISRMRLGNHDGRAELEFISRTIDDLARTVKKMQAQRVERDALIAVEEAERAAEEAKQGAERAARAAERAVAKPKSGSLAEKIKTKREAFKERTKKQRELGKKTASEKAQENYRALDIDYIKDLMSQAGGSRLVKKGVEKWAKGLLEHDITSRDGKKYKSVVEDIQGFGNNITMSGVIKDSNGNQVGQFTRSINLGDKYIYHNVFTMEADQQGNGVGSAFIQASEHLYRQAGFKTVGVTGVSNSRRNRMGNLSWTGATTWPQQGFDWKDDSAKRQFLGMLQDAVDRHGNDPEYFANRQQADDLIELIEEAKKQALGSEDAIHPGMLLDWPGSTRHFAERGAGISYLKKLD